MLVLSPVDGDPDLKPLRGGEPAVFDGIFHQRLDQKGGNPDVSGIRIHLHGHGEIVSHPDLLHLQIQAV